MPYIINIKIININGVDPADNTPIYPYELFPTHVRGTGGGFTTTISRIASAISTFFFPVILDNFGVSITMYIAAFLLMIGFVISAFMAPETKSML